MTKFINMAKFLIISLLLAAAFSSIAYSDKKLDPRIDDSFPGKPPICPRWAFEPWVWDDNNNTQVGVMNLVDGYQSRGIPVGAVIIDSPWSTAYNNFDWDKKRYPKPQEMINTLHQKNIKVILWMTAFINLTSVKEVQMLKSPDYDFTKRMGYVVGDGANFRWWKGRGIHLDYTNPAARYWWHTKLDKVINLGIDGFKTDDGAHQVSDPIKTSLGVMSRLSFKRYYFADTIDYLLSKNPNGIIVSRAYNAKTGYEASISKSTISWPGDNEGNWDGFNQQLGYIYISAQSGYGAPGAEIGGYTRAIPDKNTLIRWAQFGAMTPLMENGGVNGGDTGHLPWFHDQQTVDIYRYFATLHSELVPYIFSYSVESHKIGKSIIRHANFEKKQHCLGEELFVSVIPSDVTSINVELPKGSKWIDYWDESTIYKQTNLLNFNVPLEKYPIFIKAGSVLPMNVKNALTGHGDESSSNKTTLVFYPYGKSSFTYHMPIDDGIKYKDIKIQIDEAKGSITLRGAEDKNYRLRVKSFAEPKSISGAQSWNYDSTEKYILIDASGKSIQIKIDGLSGYSNVTSI